MKDDPRFSIVGLFGPIDYQRVNYSEWRILSEEWSVEKSLVREEDGTNRVSRFLQGKPIVEFKFFFLFSFFSISKDFKENGFLLHFFSNRWIKLTFGVVESILYF